MPQEPRPNQEASTVDKTRHEMFGKGSIVGNFEIVTLLGAGGMGEVYQARNPLLQRDVALKVVHASLIAGVSTGGSDSSARPVQPLR